MEKQTIHQLYNSLLEAFEAINMLYFVVELSYDKNGKAVDIIYREVSPSTEKLMGKTKDEIIGKSRKELFGDINDEFPAKFDNVAKTGKPEHFNSYGAALQKYYDVYSWRVGKNQVGAIITDITERKKTEEVAIDTENRLRFALEVSHTGAWDLDLMDHTAVRSLEHDRIFGYEKLLPKWTYEMFLGHVLPEDRAMVNDRFKHAIKTKGDWNFECRIRRVNGQIRWIWAVGRHVLSDGGAIRRMVGIVQDITERKKAEEALKESEQLYRTVFDNSEDGFELFELIYDNNGKPIDQRYLKINNGFLKQTGIEKPDIVGKTPKEILPNVEPHWFDIPYRVVKTGKSEHIEDYNQDTKRWYDAYFFRYSANTIGGLFRDITERKNLEKLLQEKERMAGIGATAGMVGHDIRNPLQAMISDVYLMRSELSEMPQCATKEGIKESLESLENNIVYVNKIVGDLQDYTRPLQPHKVQIKVADKISNSLKNVRIPQNIQLHVAVQEGLVIETDADYFRRALTNLINNAVQAMPNGGDLTIEAMVQKGKVMFIVQDTGVGISEEVKPNLFKPLFTTKSKGQGLGLAVVKRLVEALNGKVSFESKVGKGTKFTIELPIVQINLRN